MSIISIISKSRINKVKKQLESEFGKPEYFKFMIRARNGLFLINLKKKPCDGRTYIPIDNEMPGLKLYDCSCCNIEEIIVIGNGKNEPSFVLEDIPYVDRIAEGYINNPEKPFQDFEDNELKEIIKCCEN